MSKFYAVKTGKNPGIYTSWTECEKNVKGFSGAIYKSFTNRKEAEAFLSQNVSPLNFDNMIGVFTDGSHSKHEENGYKGFGAFCSYRGKEYLFSGNCDDMILEKYGIDPKAKISNPTLEFLAFAELLSMIYETKKDFKKYTFLFKIDYDGVRNWMNNSWSAKELYIKKIKNQCEFYIRHITAQIQIEHVPGHAGVYGNEKADQLSKSHIAINTFPELFSIL